MSYVARCALCLDTSPHCPCRWQGNGYWAPGSSSLVAKPCSCVICADAAKRAELAAPGLIDALEKELGGPIELVETSWGRRK